MNNISLVVSDKSSNNSFHVKLFVDEKDVGVLYLSETQLDFLSQSIKNYAREEGVHYFLENLFDFSDEDEVDYPPEE